MRGGLHRPDCRSAAPRSSPPSSAIVFYHTLEGPPPANASSATWLYATFTTDGGSTFAFPAAQVRRGQTHPADPGLHDHLSRGPGHGVAGARRAGRSHSLLLHVHDPRARSGREGPLCPAHCRRRHPRPLPSQRDAAYDLACADGSDTRAHDSALVRQRGCQSSAINKHTLVVRLPLLLGTSPHVR